MHCIHCPLNRYLTFTTPFGVTIEKPTELSNESKKDYEPIEQMITHGGKKITLKMNVKINCGEKYIKS
jgi:hypothetical protein